MVGRGSKGEGVSTRTGNQGEEDRYWRFLTGFPGEEIRHPKKFNL